MKSIFGSPQLKLIIALNFLLAVASHADINERSWTPLLDPDLSQWESYLSYRLTDEFDGTVPKNKDGSDINPFGYNHDPANVFSTKEENNETILRISGEIYGCLFTKNGYKNYHLKLQTKWGSKKWEPRKNKLLDSGLLYHSIGACGVDYWKSWMLAQEFQIMEGHTGDYWPIANSAIDIRAYAAEGSVNAVANQHRPFVHFGAGTGKSGFCLRSHDNENPKDQWTTIELICFEGKSIHIVNNQIVMVLQNSRYLEDEQFHPLNSGKLQLQSEAGEVFFKDIKIKQIESIPESYQHLF